MCLVALLLAGFFVAWTYQIWCGMGTAGKRTPQMWAMYITTFVFWIGIGHAGTLISAVLYLFRARWRTSIYRGAEAMTIFAVMTAGLFPLIHAGRMWFAYFLLPYPNQRYLWPNFKSPLVWDVFAISTYLSISTVFFIVGLVPDIAALRDASTGWRRRIYGMLALGWEGSDRQWRHYRRAYGLLAALATPLVLSVHSVVSWDFAMALVPGWHSTLFAPFFVDGAIFSGFAMVLMLVLPMRHFFDLHAYIQDRHLDVMAKLILVTGLVLTYFYICELFTSLVQRRSLREGLAVLEADGDVLVGAVDHVLLQLRRAAHPLLEAGPHEPGHPLRRVDPGPDRDVVRALQHHRAVARPRLLPVHLGHLRADASTDSTIIDRQLRLVLPAVPRLHQADAVAVDRRGEGDDPAADEGHGACRPPLRPSSASSPTSTPRCGPWRSCSAKGYHDLTVYTPVPVHEIEDVVERDRPVSRVRLFTLIGGLTGIASAWILTSWTSLQWGLIMGGKLQPVSGAASAGLAPPYVIITFELMILFGGIATVIGMVVLGRLPQFRPSPSYDPRFTNDRFGVAVHCAPERAASVREILRGAGAEEVRA